MITNLTDSQLSIRTSTQSQKAWHLLSLLLTIGRPARPPELAARCTSFPASPQLVQLLCSIPHSPLFLTTDLFVTPSLVALQFALTSNSVHTFMPKRFSNGDVRKYFWKRKEFTVHFDLVPFSKRRLFLSSVKECEEDVMALPSQSRVHDACTEVLVCEANDRSTSMSMPLGDMSDMTSKFRISCKLMALANSEAESSGYGLKNIEQGKAKKMTNKFVNDKMQRYVYTPECLPGFLNINTSSDTPHPIVVKGIAVCEHDPKPAPLTCIMENPVVWNEAPTGKGGKSSKDPGHTEEEMNHLFLSFSTAPMDTMLRNVFRSMNMMNHNDVTPMLDREPITIHEKSQALLPATEPSISQEQQTKSSANMKMVHRDALTPRLPAPSKSSKHSRAVEISEEKQQSKTNHKKRKLKQNNPMCIKEKGENSFSISSKNQFEPKILPKFDAFIVEEEEGSGGYGTVYKARRKTDGMTFAIKCPHENAHRHHVNNELRMLERFGGKNFIIKYEGSFKIGNQDYCVLEHIDHDRPEVLKREIDIFQLQWYAYCMFRALASLHRKGIVHRDVKPGNFLFSRKVNKGYLIDFNLAMDLCQKYGTISKPKEGHSLSFNQVTVTHPNSVPPTKSRKIQSTKSLETHNWYPMKGSKLTLEPKNMKKKPDFFVRKAKEPLPCQGRKELISLAQEAMQNPNHESSRGPASKRKRVAAPPGEEEKVDKKFVYISPMPLHAAGIAVAGAGLLKNKGDGKQKREGPCVGTKGFRAPEHCNQLSTWKVIRCLV
ncbi:Cell division cycle 7-related protein kinase [Vitis vinifera]|uniref:non-specific serine/threonine protein kinase n=1 Tax=Vitis vinifera TaxID=29760 RepID=A0A438ET85_VITVI|nr:Cell division cycle 7-related protein kinase [Vitis vinifera]